MAFRKVCTLDELWEGEMTEVEVDGHEVLLVWPEKGQVQAFQSACPHQEISLGEGDFDGRVVTCRAHEWTFDGESGGGINPRDCKLARYPVKIEGEDVYVDPEGVTPLFAHK